MYCQNSEVFEESNSYIIITRCIVKILMYWKNHFDIARTRKLLKKQIVLYYHKMYCKIRDVLEESRCIGRIVMYQIVEESNIFITITRCI